MNALRRIQVDPSSSKPIMTGKVVSKTVDMSINPLCRSHWVSMLFLIAVATFPAQAKTWHVPRDFATIQEAVDAAADGDAIKVSAGVYTENVVVDKRIRLRGSGRPVIEAADASGDVVIITANRVRIKGFEVRGGNRGIAANRPPGGPREVEQVIIERNSVHNNKQSGILVFGNENRIEDNEAFDNGDDGISVAGDTNRVEDNKLTNNVFSGIQVNGDDNRIEDNKAFDNEREGFSFISNSNGNRIQDNQASRNGTFGFEVIGNGNRIKDNQAFDNPNREGFFVSGDGNRIEDNDAEGNGGADFPGFFIGGDGNRIEDNGARGNGGAGFRLGNGGVFFAGSQNIVKDNQAEDNSGDGFVAGSGTFENIFEDNRAEGNTGYGFRDQGTDNEFIDNECKDNDLGTSMPEGLCED